MVYNKKALKPLGVFNADTSSYRYKMEIPLGVL